MKNLPIYQLSKIASRIVGSTLGDNSERAKAYAAKKLDGRK